MEKYLVTDVANISIIREYPVTIEGFNSAVTVAVVLAQCVEMYPAGVAIERRYPDNTIKGIVTITDRK